MAEPTNLASTATETADSAKTSQAAQVAEDALHEAQQHLLDDLMAYQPDTSAYTEPLSDDATKATSAREQWQAFKADVKTEIKRQIERIQHIWFIRDLRSIEQWQQLLLRHPLLRIFAINLIWVYYPQDDRDATSSFRALDDGALTDALDNPVELPPGMSVRRAWEDDLGAQEANNSLSGRSTSLTTRSSHHSSSSDSPQRLSFRCDRKASRNQE